MKAWTCKGEEDLIYEGSQEDVAIPLAAMFPILLEYRLNHYTELYTKMFPMRLNFVSNGTLGGKPTQPAPSRSASRRQAHDLRSSLGTGHASLFQ